MSCILKLVIVRQETKVSVPPMTFKRFLVLTVRWFFPTKTESHISLSIRHQTGENMPKLNGILKTAIHTQDMTRSRAFYEDVLGLEAIHSDNRLSAYAVAGRDVLLIFRKGTTEQTVSMPSGTIPGHGGDGALHLAFAIDKDELDRWEIRLAASGVTVEGRNDWARGLILI
jgi:catechol 2,3-dioxygenase-like lactoylglutathione lyase family enzyme